MRLSKIAPWNSDLRNPYRTRYAEHGGRYFRVQADHLRATWDLEEIDRAGNAIAKPDGSTFITFARNLPAVCRAIEDYVAGEKPHKQIFDEGLFAPGAGTGKNHPRNVEGRASRRNGSWDRADVAARRAEQKTMPEHVKDKVQPGHSMVWNPPGLSSIDRWSCTNPGCEASVLASGRLNVYGSATEQPCTSPTAS